MVRLNSKPKANRANSRLRAGAGLALSCSPQEPHILHKQELLDLHENCIEPDFSVPFSEQSALAEGKFVPYDEYRTKLRLLKILEEPSNVNDLGNFAATLQAEPDNTPPCEMHLKHSCSTLLFAPLGDGT